MAGTTRLELATSGVTGRRSNQLNYVPVAVWVLGRTVEPPAYVQSAPGKGALV